MVQIAFAVDLARVSSCSEVLEYYSASVASQRTHRLRTRNVQEPSKTAQQQQCFWRSTMSRPNRSVNDFGTEEELRKAILSNSVRRGASGQPEGQPPSKVRSLSLASCYSGYRFAVSLANRDAALTLSINRLLENTVKKKKTMSRWIGCCPHSTLKRRNRNL